MFQNNTISLAYPLPFKILVESLSMMNQYNMKIPESDSETDDMDKTVPPNLMNLWMMKQKYVIHIP